MISVISRLHQRYPTNRTMPIRCFLQEKTHDIPIILLHPNHYLNRLHTNTWIEDSFNGQTKSDFIVACSTLIIVISISDTQINLSKIITQRNSTTKFVGLTCFQRIKRINGNSQRYFFRNRSGKTKRSTKSVICLLYTTECTCVCIRNSKLTCKFYCVNVILICEKPSTKNDVTMIILTNVFIMRYNYDKLKKYVNYFSFKNFMTLFLKSTSFAILYFIFCSISISSY